MNETLTIFSERVDDLPLLLDVHFISSLPVMPETAYKAWVDSKPVQRAWGVD